MESNPCKNPCIYDHKAKSLLALPTPTPLALERRWWWMEFVLWAASLSHHNSSTWHQLKTVSFGAFFPCPLQVLEVVDRSEDEWVLLLIHNHLNFLSSCYHFGLRKKKALNKYLFLMAFI